MDIYVKSVVQNATVIQQTPQRFMTQYNGIQTNQYHAQNAQLQQQYAQAAQFQLQQQQAQYQLHLQQQQVFNIPSSKNACIPY